MMKSEPKTDEEGFALVLEATTKAAIAHHIGLTKQALTKWRAVPPKYLIQIEALTGVPREKILPSFYKR